MPAAMTSLVLEKGALAFGGRELFSDLTLAVDQGDRVGLIGANGSGKSTLMRVLAGVQRLDEGFVRSAKSSRIGYLSQDIQEQSQGSLLSSIMDSVPGRSELQEKRQSIEKALETEQDPERQMELATSLSELFERDQFFEMHYSEAEAKRILAGLGFENADLDRPLSEFSGGWKMRAALGGLLFQQPDVLLLDEPTNHLDLGTVLWLNDFLKEFTPAVVLICHDRTFLNRQVTRVVSFEPEGVRMYTGNYDAYREQREQEEEQLEARVRNQEQKVRELQKFVDKFKAKATKARQAQSRVKLIEKMSSKMEKQIPKPRKLSFRFPPTTRSGRDVVRFEGLGKSFGDKVLYSGVDQVVARGEKLAILGPNGAGKTTLLRMIAGELEPSEGVMQLGAKVERGYYAQHHSDQLSADRAVLEEVAAAAPDKSESFVRGVCGAFLFSGDDVEKKVGVLSGGERARVLLARLLIEPGNLLLMDEPTNHLDTESAEALAEALTHYDGTLVFVSHSESFIKRLATVIWDVGSGELRRYPGTFDEYMDHLRLLRAGDTGAADQQQKEPPKSEKDAKPPKDLKQKKPTSKKKVGQLEEKIAGLEERKTEQEEALGAPELHAQPDKYRIALEEYQETQKRLEKAYAEWERVSQ